MTAQKGEGVAVVDAASELLMSHCLVTSDEVDVNSRLRVDACA